MVEGRSGGPTVRACSSGIRCPIGHLDGPARSDDEPRATITDDMDVVVSMHESHSGQAPNARRAKGMTARALVDADGRDVSTMMAATKVDRLELAELVHDLRTPLTAIIGRAQLLSRQLQRDADATSPAVERTLSEILASARQMAGMLDDVLAVSSEPKGDSAGHDPATTSLAGILDLAIDQVEQATGQRRIHVILPGLPIAGPWDCVKVVRAVVNVLENALKYSPGGGAVVVMVRQDGADVVVTIQDQGIGIPTADLPRLFGAFVRASNVRGRFAGTGLGLASSRQLIESLGGSLELASVEGCGTTATLRLPI
jgi:signal transduction histidine kinase